MTYTNLYASIRAACIGIENSGEYTYVGVRFEDKARDVGETCECSKHNPDREDERDFPEFGSAEYDDLPELPGTSAWLVFNGDYGYAEDVDPSKIRALRKPFYQQDDEFRGYCDHAYIIAGKRCDTHSDADDGEIVIVDAVVMNVLY